MGMFTALVKYAWVKSFIQEQHGESNKKARLSIEHGDCSLPNLEVETHVTNFSDASESANGFAVYSEATSSGYCEFAENVSDLDETASINSELSCSSNSSENMTVDEECNILSPLNQPKLENTTAFNSNRGQRVSSKLFCWKTTGGAVTKLTTFHTPPLSHENYHINAPNP